MVSFYQTKGRRTAHSQRKRSRSMHERPSGIKVKRTSHVTKPSSSTRVVKNPGRASRTRKGTHHAVGYCKLPSRRFLVLHPGQHKPLEIINRAIRSFDRPEQSLVKGAASRAAGVETLDQRLDRTYGGQQASASSYWDPWQDLTSWGDCDGVPLSGIRN